MRTSVPPPARTRNSTREARAVITGRPSLRLPRSLPPLHPSSSPSSRAPSSRPRASWVGKPDALVAHRHGERAGRDVNVDFERASLPLVGMQDDVVGCLRDRCAYVSERLARELDRFGDAREGGADQRDVLGLVAQLQANVWRPGGSTEACAQSRRSPLAPRDALARARAAAPASAAAGARPASGRCRSAGRSRPG